MTFNCFLAGRRRKLKPLRWEDHDDDDLKLTLCFARFFSLSGQMPHAESFLVHFLDFVFLRCSVQTKM